MAVQWAKWNPFSVFFQKTPAEEYRQEQTQENSQGKSQEEIEMQSIFDSQKLGVFSDSEIAFVDFEPILANKASRIAKYREMSLYPEINDSLDIICDDAIITDVEGDVARLLVKKNLPAGTAERITRAFTYLTTQVLDFNNTAWEMFRKFLVEAELYLELIANDSGTDLVGSKVLPAHTIAPIYKADALVGYAQVPYNTGVPSSDGTTNMGSSFAFDAEPIAFTPSQIAYVNYGQFGVNRADIRGFLETAVRIYNQLKALEDSLIIYRLIRAPERRVWNVYTGKMPPTKAEAFLRNTIKKYKQRMVYDSTSGAVDANFNAKSMSEDIWFTKDDAGQGTTVDTVGGAANLGEIDDVKYFLKKMYRALKIPMTRTEDVNNIYASGKSGEIMREEVKFSHFVERLQQLFKPVLLDSFLTLLKMRGFDEEYLDPSIYDIKFTPSNLFKNYKELEVLEARLGVLTTVAAYIWSPENQGGLFAKEFAMRKYYQMPPDEYAQNEILLQKEKGEGGGAAVPASEGGGGEGSMTSPPPAAGGEAPEAAAPETAPEAPEAPAAAETPEAPEA